MKLSIVIPVYNVEDTLDRCVSSVLQQGIDDYEVILVDDGSTDSCPQKCNEWQAKNQHVKVIHKRNGGLSDARNAGIRTATGSYLTFVDSDDYLAPNTYRQILALMSDADIVEFPVVVYAGGQHEHRLDLKDETYKDMASYWLDGKAYQHTYAWNKIYDRKLFNTVRYPVGRVFEDIPTLTALLDNARCVKTTSQGLYYYCENGKGITATAKGKELEMLLDGQLKAMKKWQDDRYYMTTFNTQIDVFERTGKEPLMTFRRVNPLASSLNSSQRIKALSINLLGIKRTCQLWKIIHSIRPRY